MDHHDHSRHEQVDKDLRSVDELLEVEAENDSSHDGSSSRLVGEVSDDGSHLDVGCSHEVEVVHGRNTHQKVDNRHDGTVEESEIGSDRCEEPQLESRQRK